MGLKASTKSIINTARYNKKHASKADRKILAGLVRSDRKISSEYARRVYRGHK